MRLLEGTTQHFPGGTYDTRVCRRALCDTTYPRKLTSLMCDGEVCLFPREGGNCIPHVLHCNSRVHRHKFPPTSSHQEGRNLTLSHTPTSATVGRSSYCLHLSMTVCKGNLSPSYFQQVGLEDSQSIPGVQHHCCQKPVRRKWDGFKRIRMRICHCIIVIRHSCSITLLSPWEI